MKHRETEKVLSFAQNKLRIFMVMIALLVPSIGSAYSPDCTRPIMVRGVKIEDATLEEAVQYLRNKTKQDDMDRDPKGVNFVVMPPLSAIAKSAKITLKLNDAPLNDVVKLLAKLTHMRVRIEP